MTNDIKRGPLGDARPDANNADVDVHPNMPQENVENRENVGSVKPEDYPHPELAGIDPALNRGRRRSSGSGEVYGSGSGAGGGGTPEDYDDDPQGGSGGLQQKPVRDAPATKADAPVGGSR